MKMQVNKFKNKDFSLFSSWWGQRAHEVMPTRDMIPPTYWTISVDDTPIASFGFITTNLKKVCYACHLVSDANSDKNQRRPAIRALTEFVFAEARKRGFQNMLAFGYQPKLTDRFIEFGFRPTIQKLNAFCKDLENVCR